MSSKRILVLKGSPRRGSNSSTLAEYLAEGAKTAGARVESFHLHNMNIRPCDACDACRGSGDGECIIQDDMQILYPKLREADAIVVASPIYWFTMNAQTKLCIDRWYALEGAQGSALKGKRFAFVLTYADGDPMLSGAVNAVRAFQDMCRYLKADLAGLVYGTASNPGDILKEMALLDEAAALGRRLATDT